MQIFTPNQENNTNLEKKNLYKEGPRVDSNHTASKHTIDKYVLSMANYHH